MAPNRNIIVCSHMGSDLGKRFNFLLQTFAASFRGREFIAKLAMSIKSSRFVYCINYRVRAAGKWPIRVYLALRSTMRRSVVVFCVEVRAELTSCQLAHHLVGDYRFPSGFSSCEA